jgi:uncharacterized protein
MIIVDTGFWFGLLDKQDNYHLRCQSFLTNCREPLITTFPVLTEALHLLMSRGRAQQGIALFQVLEKLQADASLVLLAEHLGDGRIVSTDKRDFHTYRWKNHHPFTNLLVD